MSKNETQNIKAKTQNVKTHYEYTSIQIYWKFHHQKIESFQTKILIFFIFLLKT